MNHFEQKIYDLTNKSLESFGYSCVKVSLNGLKLKILEILIERIDGTPISIDDCKKASKHLSAIFDVEDIMQDRYNLEVSSPGAERPLVLLGDFVKYIGYDIRLVLHKSQDGKLKFRGKIEKVDDDLIVIKSDENYVNLSFGNIKSANLVLSEDLFRKILNKKES